MNYQQTLDYLFTRLPMFSRTGAAAYKADLTNTITLCASLNDPQLSFKSVHVAGTNGKGSVSHMLAAVLQTAGFKTGLYTSPHLKDFRERIKINGKMIPEDFVMDFTQKIKPLIEEIEPSFFEITVAMAFDYFRKEKVDIAIIETGLGGRLDSTNIILPELSVITNIGYDHMNLLGNSIEQIAVEKAGIIKPGIPVVIGEVLPATLPVFIEKAKQHTSSLSIAHDKLQAVNWYWQKNELIVEVSSANKQDHAIYHLDLPGIYQAKNLLTVLESVSQLRQKGWIITDLHLQEGLKHSKKLTGLHGRWEEIRQTPRVILDVAHNEDGIRQLLLQVEVTNYHNLHIILGMVNDKEIEKILSQLPNTAHYYFTRAHIPRALPEKELAKKAIAFGLKGDSYPAVNDALHASINKSHKDDLIIICGSIFLVGEVKY